MFVQVILMKKSFISGYGTNNTVLFSFNISRPVREASAQAVIYSLGDSAINKAIIKHYKHVTRVWSVTKSRM